MSLKGQLIVIEGLEGAGKTTIIERLKKQFNKTNGVVVTREPGGTEFGERLRKIILEQDLDPITELFLFEAARREHFVNVIFPALQAGKIVIMDRFTDSTVAYQTFLQNIGYNYVQNCNTLATAYTNLQLLNVNHIKPDLTIFLDIEFKEAQKRIRNREMNNKKDRLNSDEFEAIRNGYQFAFNQVDRTNKVRQINVTHLDESEVYCEVASILTGYLKEYKKKKAENHPEMTYSIMDSLQTTKLREFED